MCGIGPVERLFPSGALKQAHIPRAVGEPQSGGDRGADLPRPIFLRKALAHSSARAETQTVQSITVAV